MASISVVMAADQSGATLKFSQISKLISRLRFINVNYGSLFGVFLDGLGNSFDKENSTTNEEATDIDMSEKEEKELL